MRYLSFIFLAAAVVTVSNIYAQSYQPQWNSVVGVSSSNGILSRTKQPVNWDGGAQSFNEIPARQDGWLEFTVSDLSSVFICGFGRTDGNYNYNTTAGSWYINSTSGYTAEYGFIESISAIHIGDVLRISREGNLFKYYQNGVLKRTVPTNAEARWIIKALVYSGSAPAIRCSFDTKITLSAVVTPVNVNGAGGSAQVTASGGTLPYTYSWDSGESTPMISNKNIATYSVTVTDGAGRKTKNTYRLAQIIYVRKDAIAPGDGASWATAFPDLQQALNYAANNPGHKQIWVSHGEYHPSYTGDKSATFALPENTFLYGGFSGNETSLDMRNWRVFRTILSGDLGVAFDYADNSYHVVTAANLNTDVGFDGFIVRHGNSLDVGSGMKIVKSGQAGSLTINNCEFTENIAAVNGGGICISSTGSNGNTLIQNCFFNGNNAASGGAVSFSKYMSNDSHQVSLVNCSFSLNKASQFGGAIAWLMGLGTNDDGSGIINCTFASNTASTNGGAVFTSGPSTLAIRNSVMWKNTGGNGALNQIYQGPTSIPIVRNNLIQNGYGQPTNKNIGLDPHFESEPVGLAFPRTSIIPFTNTPITFESVQLLNGPKTAGHHSYYTYKDHTYNKLYIVGTYLQVIDYNNVTNGAAASQLITDCFTWGRIQRLGTAISNYTNRIYFAQGFQGSGIGSIDRQTGATALYDPLADENIVHQNTSPQDIVVDNSNNLLYTPVFYNPGHQFYGLLELNLVTNAKRWINTASSPALPSIAPSFDGSYWNGHRLYFDATENTLYYSMGSGVWWWNRTTNQTGVYSTTGGIPLLPGNPMLPSNLTTHIYIDHTENKFYIGTHAGLFVWDRNNNTSQVYNTANSRLLDNLIDDIDKSDELNLLYVACENGGLFTLNTKTGEQKTYNTDAGSDVNPQLVDNFISSAHYDKVDKKVYVSGWGTNGACWILDNNNLLPDYGNLNLQANSPAIDFADESAYPEKLATDIMGADRKVNFSLINGTVGLDLGAYEKNYACITPEVDFAFQYDNGGYTFTPQISNGEVGCNIKYSWDFGDGTTSLIANPFHKFQTAGDYTITLKFMNNCEYCAADTIVKTRSISVSPSFCDNIYCNVDGSVSIGTIAAATGYKLSIKGKLIMEGAKVALNGTWPDYVFTPGHRLLSLQELKRYIDQYKHLPNIPAAGQVKQNGMDVEEMSRKLLEKTEELSLYFIQIDERIKKLESHD